MAARIRPIEDSGEPLACMVTRRQRHMNLIFSIMVEFGFIRYLAHKETNQNPMGRTGLGTPRSCSPVGRLAHLERGLFASV